MKKKPGSFKILKRKNINFFSNMYLLHVHTGIYSEFIQCNENCSFTDKF